MRARKQFSNAYGIHLSKNNYIEIFALLVCLEIVLAFSALGFISIPPISLTTLSILVIVAGMYFGPIEAMVVSVVFAGSSMWKASLVSYEEGDIIFSPFLSGKPGASIVMTWGARLLFALLTGLIFRWFFSKQRKHRRFGIIVVSLVSTALHALLVYICMVVFFNVDDVETTQTFDNALLLNNVILFLVTVVIVLLCDAVMRKKGVKRFFSVVANEDVRISKNQKRVSTYVVIAIIIAVAVIFYHFTSRIVNYLLDKGFGRDEDFIGWIYALLAQFAFGFAATFAIVFIFFRWIQEYASTISNEAKKNERIRDEIIQNNARIFALEDDFESLYEVELGSGNYITYVKGDFYQKNVIDKLVKPSDYFMDLRANIDAAIYPEDREALYNVLTRKAIREELEENDHFDYYYRISTDNGPIWFRMRIVYKDTAKRSVIIGVFNAEGDIKAEQLAKALEGAQAANVAKTSFLFNMSHDIRTPMNAILGYADMAINHVENGEQVKDYLNKLKSSGEHLLSLINDILEMSRIEAGRLELSSEPLDIRNAIERTKNIGTALAIPKNIEFSVDTKNIRNTYLLGDELHLDEVLINILSNAMKYSREGGTVKYTVSQIGEPIDNKAWFCFEVTDNGIGMSDEFRAHVFETFSREKTATVSKQEGTGLGLSIVKKIVDMAGGNIEIKSKQGEGTTVIVEMPLEIMDDAAIDNYRASHEDTQAQKKTELVKGSKVLLVEDNEMNREIAEDILTEAGLVIESAEDGSVALNMIKEKGVPYYDLVLMDIQMPVMDGYEATRAIRSLPDGDKIPIIAVSANAFEEDIQKSLECGMNAHIAKPIHVDELFKTVAKYM